MPPWAVFPIKRTASTAVLKNTLTVLMRDLGREGLHFFLCTIGEVFVAEVKVLARPGRVLDGADRVPHLLHLLLQGTEGGEKLHQGIQVGLSEKQTEGV